MNVQEFGNRGCAGAVPETRLIQGLSRFAVGHLRHGYPFRRRLQHALRREHLELGLPLGRFPPGQGRLVLGLGPSHVADAGQAGKGRPRDADADGPVTTARTPG